MIMVRLIYSSQLADKCDVIELKKILEVSRKNNEKNDITGVLCYNPKFFLQWIEGPRDAINRLYHNISNDDRHTNCIILDYKEITTRQFVSWSMAYVSTLEIDQKILMKYSPTKVFNPYLMHGESAVAFLQEMTSQIEE